MKIILIILQFEKGNIENKYYNSAIMFQPKFFCSAIAITDRKKYFYWVFSIVWKHHNCLWNIYKRCQHVL